MSDDPQRGWSTIEYTFWCGACGHWHQEPGRYGKRWAANMTKRLGWTYTRKHGWRCSDCNTNTRPAGAGEGAET